MLHPPSLAHRFLLKAFRCEALKRKTYSYECMRSYGTQPYPLRPLLLPNALESTTAASSDATILGVTYMSLFSSR